MSVVEYGLLSGKVAVITGGSRGIGKAIALKYAENGASLILSALGLSELEKVRSELMQMFNISVVVVDGDVALPDTARKIRDLAVREFGRVDILVNCAGIITRTPMSDLGIEEWQRVLDVNLTGSFLVSQALLPCMCEIGGGKIINISSQMAKIAHPCASPSYEVSKAGQIALTRHMALHYAKHQICVNAISPGSIDTELPRSMSVEARQKLKDAVPLGRLGEPHEVGALAVFLASGAADYITGATINITGGSLMD